MRLQLSGRVFGQLQVTAFAYVCNRCTYWHCKCSCGNLAVVKGIYLTHGDTTSCGCAKINRVRQLKLTHGLADKIPEYSVWMSMRKRCNNCKSPGFKNYGGRGIKVCKRWNSFANFLSDMGSRPTSLHSIERRNNDGDYEPSNCCWATRSEQSHNTRVTKNFTVCGETLCLSDWAKRIGISRRTLRGRLAYMPVEEALTLPKMSKRRSPKFALV